MRFFLSILFFWFAATTATAKGRPLVVYSPHGAEILREAQAGFLKVAPDVDLDWRFVSSEEALQRILEEKNHPVADVWWGGPQFMFIRGAKSGALAPYKPSWSDKEPPAYKDPADLWYGDMQAPLTFLYQKNLVHAGDLPKDWDDFTRPAFKGKLIGRFPLDSGTMRALYLAMIDRQIGKGRTLDQALKWMLQLEGSIARYVPQSQLMFSTVGKGLLNFAFWNLPEIAMRQRQGYPIDFVYPTSGMPVLLDCVALVKKAVEHPAARRFYEFVSSKEFATKLTDDPFNRIHTRTDLGRGARPDYMDDRRYKVMAVDWQRVAEHEAEWLGRWEKEVAGRGGVSH